MKFQSLNKLMSISALIAFLFLHADRINAQKFWLTTYSFPGGPKIAITLDRHNCLIVALPSQIIRSCDDGITWDSTLSSTFLHTLFTSKSGRIFAGGSGKIFYSDDSGIRWDSVSFNHNYPFTRLIQNVNGDLFAITGTLDSSLGYVGAGVYYSPDNGASWIQRNQGLGPYLSCEQISHDRKGRLYLAVADELVSGNAGLFYSDDSGQKWQQLSVEIDGKNVIDDKINIGNTYSLSVSPDDTLLLSLTGTAVNVGVALNIRKSVNDILKNTRWKVGTVSNTSTWWNDRLLNNIHFAKNGDWYSSMKGSLNTGGTFFSKDKGQKWNKHLQGLGLDASGQFSIQYFAENDTGKIYMVQLLDERIYWADTSVLNRVNTSNPIAIQELCTYPNPISAIGLIHFESGLEAEMVKISLYDVQGNLISEQMGNLKTGFKAPENPGIYLLRISRGSVILGSCKIVVE